MKWNDDIFRKKRKMEEVEIVVIIKNREFCFSFILIFKPVKFINLRYLSFFL